jgi:hypothetical protein
MSETIESVLDQITVVFAATDEALNEWSGEGNLQFPALLGMIAIRLNWNDKQLREADPLIRFYIRRHPDWHVTRGAHGGIMRATEKQKKEAAKAAKEAAKIQMKAALEAKTAALIANTISNSSTSSNDDDEDEDLNDDLFSDV